MPLRLLALLPILTASMLLAPAHAAPPPAEVRDVPSLHHGTSVPDPYRWLEDLREPKVQSWLKAQGDATRALLDRIDGRAALEARIAELTRAGGDAVRGVVQLPGGRLFYLKRRAGEPQFKLFTRRHARAAERLVVDPTVEMRRTGVPHAIDFFKPAWDGRHVAYGLSAGGSENATLHVVEVATGKPALTPLARVSATEMHWLPDSRSLFVNQLKALAPNEPPTEYYMDSQVLWLRLGSPALVPVFGPRVTPELKLDRIDVGEVITVPGSPWLVARTTDTTVPEGKLFVAPRARLGQAGFAWRPIGDASHQVVDADLKGGKLYVLTRANAPRRKLVAVDLARGTLADARTVVSEPASGVIEWFRLVKGGIVTGRRQGTSIVLHRHAQGDAKGRALGMPGPGAAWPAATPAHDAEALIYAFTSWTEPTRFLQLAGDRSVELPLAARAPSPAGPKVVVTDVEFASHDGVKVPMTLLHREGLARDGSAPVLLNGYAAYGFSVTAWHSPASTAWLERGGVLAFVNARGSGVHGDTWHRAGFKQTKRNTWLDGVAAAKWLIAQGYGSPRTMAVMGTSAGGIFAGRVSTTAPELFAAAVYDVGVLDAVRFEESANGASNTGEFGSVKDPAEFKALLEMSTYHAIRDGVAYPGVLLVHGLNDPRVDVWHSAKTAARLQAANPEGRPALLRLDAQAGHGGGSTATQRDAMQADIYSFLLWQMGKVGLKD